MRKHPTNKSSVLSDIFQPNLRFANLQALLLRLDKYRGCIPLGIKWGGGYINFVVEIPSGMWLLSILAPSLQMLSTLLFVSTGKIHVSRKAAPFTRQLLLT